MRRNRAGWRDRGYIREVVGAWVVVLLVVTAGLALTWHQVPDASERIVLPRWYDPPIGETDAWEEDAPMTGAVVKLAEPDIGASMGDPSPICDTIAGLAPSPTPVSTASSNGGEKPC